MSDERTNPDDPQAESAEGFQPDIQPNADSSAAQASKDEEKGEKIGIYGAGAVNHAAESLEGLPIYATTKEQEDRARSVYGQPPVSDAERQAAEYLASDEGKQNALKFDGAPVAELSAVDIVEQGHEDPAVEHAAAEQVAKGAGDGVVVPAPDDQDTTANVIVDDGVLKVDTALLDDDDDDASKRKGRKR